MAPASDVRSGRYPRRPCGSKGRRLTCRLVAIRTPPEVAQKCGWSGWRNPEEEGAEAERGSERVLCQWTVLITNLLDTERFSMEQLWVLYRVRWQIELMFKRWKSGGGWGSRVGALADRVLCEFLAKLLAVLIKHWATLLRGGPLCVVGLDTSRRTGEEAGLAARGGGAGSSR